VLLEARTLDDLDEAEDDSERRPPLFPVRAVLEPGNMTTYDIEGVDPGDEPLQAFIDALDADGWVIEVRASGGDYTITVDGEERPVLYALFAVPENVSAGAALARVTELTASWDGPVTWAALAEAAGDEDTAAQHRALAESFA
jgi:hypothetical protein